MASEIVPIFETRPKFDFIRPTLGIQQVRCTYLTKLISYPPCLARFYTCVYLYCKNPKKLRFFSSQFTKRVIFFPYSFLFLLPGWKCSERVHARTMRRACIAGCAGAADTIRQCATGDCCSRLWACIMPPLRGIHHLPLCMLLQVWYVSWEHSVFNA